MTYGGRQGILNQASLESALQRPYSGYYRAIQKKAAALVQSVTCNHGFVDGNKRTCLLLLGLLLDRSGYRLEKDGSPETNEAVEQMIASVADGMMSFEQIHDWMIARIGKAPDL